MYFESIENLPGHIRLILPENWQRLYQHTFNTAYKDYRNDVLAHKIAWGIIEKAYPKHHRRKKK